MIRIDGEMASVPDVNEPSSGDEEESIYKQSSQSVITGSSTLQKRNLTFMVLCQERM